MHRKAHPFGRRRGLRWQYRETLRDGAGEEALQSVEVDVGGNLRLLREEQHLTIRALAERSGLSANTLSLIENGRSSPSVSTLQQAAAALGVPITAFFETDISENNVAYVKACRRPRATFDHGTIDDLAAGANIEAVEPFVVALDPNAGSGPQDIVHTGYEFVYCLEGRIAYTIDGQTYLLEPGDSLLFEAPLPHRWQNLETTKSRSIVVLFPSDENDAPTERHFGSDGLY